jgi:hypothetical protein
LDQAGIKSITYHQRIFATVIAFEESKRALLINSHAHVHFYPFLPI